MTPWYLILVLLLTHVSGWVRGQRWKTEHPGIFTLPQAGIQFSLPNGWRITGKEHSPSDHRFSPPMPPIGVVYLSKGDERLVLGYQIFDPKYGPTQRHRWSDFARYRRSRSARGYTRFRGTEAVGFEYEKPDSASRISMVRGVVFAKGLVECLITTRVVGTRPVVEKRMRLVKPAFAMISQTMRMKGPVSHQVCPCRHERGSSR